MKETEFPLPEAEAQKLDVVEETIAHQPMRAKVDDAVRSNPWMFVAAAGLLGFACGMCLGRR